MPGAPAGHRPAPGQPVPTATYRLQVQPAFTFDDAAGIADYVAALGVSHAYLSPVLQAAPGSTHGYDVVDPAALSRPSGGRPAFDRLVARLREEGLGVVVDVVPNHMATPTPAWLNAPWWSLLKEGRGSPFASWFDVDWDAEDGHVVVPVLGSPLQDVLRSGEITLERAGGAGGDEPVLRYFDHVFPVAAGTESLGPAELVAAQHYRLCDWREGSRRLNYRRFFDVTTLAGVRVEDPAVFDATHALLLELQRAGKVDAFRIDHPDGLADPRGYLARLASATGDAWVVVEKILEGQERLPADWQCAGTTGYDALMRVGGVFVDPAGAGPLTSLLEEVTGERQGLAEVVLAAKWQVVRDVLEPEVARLLRLLGRVLPQEDPASLRRALEGLLVGIERYRAYAVPGEAMSPDDVEALAHAEARARELLDVGDRDVVGLVAGLARGERVEGADAAAAGAAADFLIRFQQTCGPVMAKAIEDTAFYRYARLVSLNEVGGDPAVVGVAPADLHAFARRLLAEWPTTMTTLSTHDTKRSEDVRARLAPLSEVPGEWASWVREARHLAAAYRRPELDGATEYLLWQTLVGAWPIDEVRLSAYATKAIREAKLHTSWTGPDEGYEQAVTAFVAGALGDADVRDHVAAWHERTWEASRAVVLGQKLLQLLLVGVPDVYQGTELVDLSLVDPDNRRPVDYRDRRERLARLDGGEPPRDLDDEKLLVTSRALRLRRDRPEWFTGEEARWEPVVSTTPHALAVGRGDQAGVRVVGVVSRLTEGLRVAGGWLGHTVELPAGRWRDVLTGREHTGMTALADLLDSLPVALLEALDD